MELDRIIIGVLFNKRIFRLPSIGGLVVDELLELKDRENILGRNYFNQVQNPNANPNDYTVSLINENTENALHIRTEDFVLRKSLVAGHGPLKMENVTKEFNLLWKCANKTIKFPHIRRLGVVAEFKIGVEEGESAAVKLIKKVTNFTAEGGSSKFNLQFENRELLEDGQMPSHKTDEYWNVITHLYNSELDETPEKNMIKLSLDVQKFYNPAKVNPEHELRLFKDRFQVEKRKIKDKLIELGLS